MTPSPAIWYCVDPLGRRHGPMPKAALQRAIAHRALGPDNLVWRQGLAAWQPLSAMTDELGALPPPVVAQEPRIAPAPAAAPLPADAIDQSVAPGATVPDAVVDTQIQDKEDDAATATDAKPIAPAPAASPTATPDAMPGRRVGKWPWIALAVGVLVIAALIVFIEVVTPAYRRYVDRSIVTAVMQEADALKPRIAQGYAHMRRCAGNGEAGFGSPYSYADRYLASVATGAYNHLPGQCALQLTLSHETPPPLAGRHIWLISIPVSDPDRWTCITDLPAEIVPSGCRR